MRRKYVIAAVGVIIVAGVIAAGFYFRPWEQTADPEAEQRTAIVERGNMLVVVSASGTVVPQTTAALDEQLCARNSVRRPDRAISLGRSVARAYGLGGFRRQRRTDIQGCPDRALGEVRRRISCHARRIPGQPCLGLGLV